jgi:DNA-binding MarR family transcriptional regulator
MAIEIRRTDDTEAWGALLIAHARVNHELDRELRESTPLHLGRYEVLLILATAEGERLRMSELADALVLSRSAATRTVDRLERDGMVERSVCDSDRRGTEVSLTDAGRDAFVAAGRVHLRGIEERFGAHLSAEEKAIMTSALTRVANANPVDAACDLDEVHVG